MIAQNSQEKVEYGCRRKGLLKGKGQRAELVTRAITKGGDIVTRRHLIGEVPGIRGEIKNAVRMEEERLL